jgi:hypothetical protein
MSLPNIFKAHAIECEMDKGNVKGNFNVNQTVKKTYGIQTH